MFISVFDLFKVGIGPSSSHTMGPMVAANQFLAKLAAQPAHNGQRVRCTLKGSLAFTGQGHATDQAVVLGLHGYLPADLADKCVSTLYVQLCQQDRIELANGAAFVFDANNDVIFDTQTPANWHPNEMTLACYDAHGQCCVSETYCSIGGGFVVTADALSQLQAPIKGEPASHYPYPFNSGDSMLLMAQQHDLAIHEMKARNELLYLSHQGLESVDEVLLDARLQIIWQAMRRCVENGLSTEGVLPGGLNVRRRAHALHQQLLADKQRVETSDWLCAYAMAVNEENAAGHMVVTAPTNGAAGVIPAVLYYLVQHEGGEWPQIRAFLLSAAAIGGLIKHRSSISGAEVGCQGEVGSASAMAAAGLCAARGATAKQVEHAAEMALEHHLGMTCDPVKGLVQVPCIERNGFGAMKAVTAANLAMRENGEHLMSLDRCIEAMKQTGAEMSHKYKETSLGGLAVIWVEC
ncbi:MAG: L-serine ammonia-lyase [Proteobacteria bacterium]|nr:L-serine ammonia-lyase [Pseudomonadota bacterium]